MPWQISAWPEMDVTPCGPPSDDAKTLKSANRMPNAHFHVGINDGQNTWDHANCAGFLFPSPTDGLSLPQIKACLALYLMEPKLPQMQKMQGMPNSVAESPRVLKRGATLLPYYINGHCDSSIHGRW